MVKAKGVETKVLPHFKNNKVVVEGVNIIQVLKKLITKTHKGAIVRKEAQSLVSMLISS